MDYRLPNRAFNFNRLLEMALPSRDGTNGTREVTMMITTRMVMTNLAVGTITYDDGDGKVYGIEKAKGWRTCCDRRHIGQVTPSQRFFLQVREYLFNQVGN